MSVKSIEAIKQSYYLDANVVCVLEELERLSRKIEQIENILKLFCRDKRSFFETRARLFKAISERRMMLNFLKQTNTEKYLKALQRLSLDC